MTDLKTRFKLPLRALGLLLVPPRCLSCELYQNEALNLGLCSPCFGLLSPNDGHRCATCDLPIPESSSPRCRGCSLTPPSFTNLRAPYHYGGPLAEVIKAVKFNQRVDLIPSLARLLTEDPEASALVNTPNALLVPIPTSRPRLIRRGHNQAALLARALARRWKLPIRYLLKQVRAPAPQSTLSKFERAQQLAGAFKATAIPQETVLVLIDDVVTTGATVRHAAEALYAQGATEVRVLSVARTLA